MNYYAIFRGTAYYVVQGGSKFRQSLKNYSYISNLLD